MTDTAMVASLLDTALGQPDVALCRAITRAAAQMLDNKGVAASRFDEPIVEYSATKLREAGFNAAQLFALNFKGFALREAGFSVLALVGAGKVAKDLNSAG
jgi:intracellular multiplication protein IcmE